MALGGNQRAQQAYRLAESYDVLLSTILVWNNLVNITSASIAAVVFTNFFGNAGVTISTVFMTVLILIFGEITPKSLAKESPERLAMAFAPVLRALIALLRPVNWVFMQWKALVGRVFAPHADPGMTEEELLTIVEEAESDGEINVQESKLIRSAIEFYDAEAADVLTPRVDMVAVEEDAPMEEVEELFRSSGYSRLPVYRETTDHILGVIHEKDFYLNRDLPSVEPLVHPVPFVTTGAKISALLTLLQKSKSHMAIVVDEYGGTEGLVTMEDILEELVGEIYDEHDEVIEEVQRQNDGSYRVLCSADLDKLMELFDIREEFDAATVSGWVMEQLDRVPRVGDEFDFQSIHVRVLRVDARRALEIEVRPIEAAPAADEAE